MMSVRRLLVVSAAAAVSLAAVSLAAGLLPAPGQTLAVLLPQGGAPPDNASGSPVISSTGRVVAFVSQASNLIAADVDSLRDVVVVDLTAGVASCASVSSAGVKADGECSDPALDRKGRRVAFSSFATNLVEGDGNGFEDVFVHDRKTGQTVRASLSTEGVEANGDSEHPELTADGRRVVFSSYATNLVAGDTNDASDIFVHELLTGETTRVSLNFLGEEASEGSFLPEISANGRFVAFMSYAPNLTPLDTNPARDVFVRDLKTGDVDVVSVDSDGLSSHAPSGSMAMSASGRHVVFESDAQGLDDADHWLGADVFVRDRKLRTTTLISGSLAGTKSDGDAFAPAISGNGRWGLFASASSHVVEGDGNGVADVFRRDLKTGVTTRVSLSSQGTEGQGDSSDARASRDGRYVIFGTRADDLVEGATNGVAVVALTRP